MRRKFVPLLAVGLMIQLLMPLWTFAAESRGEESQVVRVGWYTSDGVQYKDEAGNREGYCYDYYQEIARYTNVTYEYVPGTWSECLQMLKDGKIDVLSYVQYTPERDRYLDFTSTQLGQNHATLTKLNTNTEIVPGNEATFNGKTVGCVAGAAQRAQLEAQMKKNGYQCKIVEYKDVQNALDALNSGEIDLLLSTNFRRLSEREVVVDQFSPGWFYLAVTQGNTQLLDRLNQALLYIKTYDPNLNDRLMQKYFSGDTSNSLILTASDRSFLNSIGTVRVVAFPREGYDSYQENGVKKGIDYALARMLTKALGLKMEYTEARSWDEVKRLAKEPVPTFIAGYDYDYDQAREDGVVLSTPYTTTAYYRVTSSRKSDGSGTGIALAKPLSILKEGILGDETGSEITWYETQKECLDAVAAGEQAVTYCESITGEYLMNGVSYRNLDANIIHEHGSLCFAVAGDQARELSLLVSKAVSSFGSEAIDDCIQENKAVFRENVSINELMIRHPALLIGILSAVFAVVILLMNFASRIHLAQVRGKAAMESAKNRSDFFANVSHDMRTPLNGMIGFTDLALEADSVEEKDDCLKKIRESGEFMLQLINDTLDISKIESQSFVLEPKAVEAVRMLEGVMVSVSRMAEEQGVHLCADTTGMHLQYIYVDQMRLQQILLNLLSNAIKFTPQGGTVELFICDLETPVRGTDCRITVWDNGIGMSPEFQKHMYEPFSQEHTAADSNLSGTGLGLSIVKRLVDLMGGFLQVSSEPGRGTRFDVYLPIQRLTDYQPEKPRTSPLPETLEGKRMLLCEDHPLNTELVRRLLEKRKITVTCAADGQEGVRLFSESPEGTFDVILMDVRMPVMDGLEATRRIRSLHRADAKRVPIIAMTANAYDEDRKNCMEAGMNTHLAKPIDPREFYHVLAEQIRQAVEQ